MPIVVQVSNDHMLVYSSYAAHCIDEQVLTLTIDVVTGIVIMIDDEAAGVVYSVPTRDISTTDEINERDGEVGDDDGDVMFSTSIMLP